MVDSELGEIPKGWKVNRLNDIVDCFDNKRVPLSSMERNVRKGIYPYYGAASLMDYIDDYLFDGVYILMGEDGSVTDNIGYPVLQYVFGKFWVNRNMEGNMKDLDFREIIMLYSLSALSIIFGIFPNLIFDISGQTVKAFLNVF